MKTLFNPKSLGCVLVAFFAMSAMFASPASAQTFTSEASTTIFTGTQVETNVFTTDSGNIECGTAFYSGHVVGQEAESATVSLTYDQCTMFGQPAVIQTNGCDFVVHASGILDIECPGSEEVEVEPGAFGCVVIVPEQTGLGHLGFSNGGSGTTEDITVESTVSSVTYREIGGACLGSGWTSNGEFTGSVTVTGEDGSSNHVGISHDG